MNSLKTLVTALIFLFATSAFGQDRAEMADAMRSDGKIYVVVAIIAIVLAGLIFYLFTIEKKVKKLEKLVSDRKKQTI
jgi:hypothetical protein